MRKEDEGRVAKYFKENHPDFLSACEKSGLKPTRRQVSKWLRRTGKAFKEGR
jgi:hypothetical protein